jgi:apolipoprotein N-acyltransferase
VRAANTGISGFVDPTGRVSGDTPLFKEAVSKQPVVLLNTPTFYTSHGDLLPKVCTVVALLFCIGRIYRYSKQ